MNVVRQLVLCTADILMCHSSRGVTHHLNNVSAPVIEDTQQATALISVSINLCFLLLGQKEISTVSKGG